MKDRHDSANNVSENGGLLDHKEEGLQTLRMLETIHTMGHTHTHTHTHTHIPEDMNLQNVYTPFQYIFILIPVFTYL